MEIQQGYDLWASQYDSNENKTRDLEAVSFRELLANTGFNKCLEIGCGTGKNTVWLAARGTAVIALDFSSEMLQIAKNKIVSEQVEFLHADIRDDWNFPEKTFDLICFSLVLEHIENLEEVMIKAAQVTKPGASMYIGELHPYRQYKGSKARFEMDGSELTLQCYNHHASDFIDAAENNGFDLITLKEYFHNSDRSTLPGVLALLFKKKVQPETIKNHSL